MSELQGLLDREAHRVSAAPGALESVLHRADRRRRNRRIGSAVLALVLAAAAISTLVKAFEQSEPKPARWPKITVENVARLQLAWTATQPGGCCPTSTVSGDRVYVAGKKGLTAYPTDCGTGGVTCAPIWVGTPDHVRRYMLAPVADGHRVFAVDGKNLYAFARDCASGGSSCGPSWVATFEGPLEPSPPAVGGGLVFTAAHNHTYAFREDCGTGGSVCEPVWVGAGQGPPSVIDGTVYGWECATVGHPCAANDLHRVFAWSLDCIAAGGTCQPSWFGLVRGLAAFPSTPSVWDGRVYFGSGNRLYAFPVDCRSDGGRCEPVWIGATGQSAGGRVQSWTFDGGMVFAGVTGKTHLTQARRAMSTRSLQTAARRCAIRSGACTSTAIVQAHSA